MATFPESPAPIYPLIIEPQWYTLISQQAGGVEQRRQKTEFPVFNVTVQYRGLTPTTMSTLYAFYMARKGARESFYIYDLALLNGTSFAHTDLYCGTGDGDSPPTDTFDIPGRSTSSQSIYVDDVLQTITTDYTISAGTGASGSDQVAFESGSIPAEGAIVTVNFTGYLRMKVRFAEDRLSRELFNYRLFNFGIQLKGLS